MPIGQIIVGGIVALIAILSGIYCSFTARGKGTILSNTYLFLSKEERTKADRKAEYKLVTVVFFLHISYICTSGFVYFHSIEMDLYTHRRTCDFPVDLCHS